MSDRDQTKRAEIGEIFLACVYAAFLLSFSESVFCILGGWRLPWDVALGLYFSEIALGTALFFLLAAGGRALAGMLKLDPLAAAVGGIYLGFPMLFGLHWLIGVDTLAFRYKNLLCYCIVSGIMAVVWALLGRRSDRPEGVVDRPTLGFWLLFPVASMFLFMLYLIVEQPDRFFPLFYALYAAFFVTAGALTLARHGRKAEEASPPIRARHGLAAIVLAGAVLAAIASAKSMFLDLEPAYVSPKNGARGSKGPNVILISLDALRADRLYCYGYPMRISAGIDWLAYRGVRFEHATAQAPQALYSLSSLFTSRYPHQLEDGGIAGTPSLPEILKNNGYTTVAFTGGDPVSKRDFGAHFDFFNDTGEQMYRLRQSHSLVMSLLHLRRFARRFGISARPLNITNHWRFRRPATVVARASFKVQRQNATKWLIRHGKDNSFFMFLQTNSIQNYFLNRKAARENARALNPGYVGVFDGVNLDYRSEYPREQKDVAQLHALYAGGIFEADKELGQFFLDLQRLNLWADTIIVLLSGHGEGFQPGLGRVWHGDRLNEDLLHVPLIIVFPDRIPIRKTVRSQVALLDVMPTALDFLDIEIPDELEGVSLKPFIEKKRARVGPRRIYSEMAAGRGVALRAYPHKYIKYSDRSEFYNIKSDPRELTNLAPAAPPAMESLQPFVDEFFTKAAE